MYARVLNFSRACTKAYFIDDATVLLRCAVIANKEAALSCFVFNKPSDYHDSYFEGSESFPEREKKRVVVCLQSSMYLVHSVFVPRLATILLAFDEVVVLKIKLPEAKNLPVVPRNVGCYEQD